MKKVVTLFLVILMSAVVLAAQGSTNTIKASNLDVGEAREVQYQVMSNIAERIKAGEGLEFRERMREGEELEFGERKILIKKINGDRLELKGENGSIVRTRLQLNNEDDAEKLKVKLSNGRNAEIKIMPEVASERAIQRLRLKNCDEASNCTIELKEVGEGNKTRAVYEAKVQKQFRLLGIFKSEREVITQIDAETGEEVLTKRPWWSWMAIEEEIE